MEWLAKTEEVSIKSMATGGDGGIRTLDRTLQPYNGLANRRLQPLGHVSTQATGTLCLHSNMRFEVCPSKHAMARPPQQIVVPRLQAGYISRRSRLDGVAIVTRRARIKLASINSGSIGIE
jgi:hypothetical protein